VNEKSSAAASGAWSTATAGALVVTALCSNGNRD
jgi:hypothetical protein